ncbi:uncharacterized protein LOC114936143 [Nylanderia fulva]|uniref:uncharacterized protein LOC114936143 n=1 Tax=Nylanderia fulva TaxID=613905 RepID=UPI0010FB3F57|nr:uncharacterized protein LOC114936143 [Nylanderia fulva]
MEGSEVIPAWSFPGRREQHQHSVLQFAQHSHTKKSFYRPDKLARMRNAWCRKWKANLYYTLPPATVLRDRIEESMVKINPTSRSETRNVIVFAGPALIEMILKRVPGRKTKNLYNGEVERGPRKGY